MTGPFDGFNVRPGIFGVTQIQGTTGLGIRIGEYLIDGNADWSHAFVIVGPGANGLQVIEAEPGGARLRDLAEYAGRPVAFNDEQPIDDAFGAKIAAAAIALRGTPYGFIDYAALAATRLHIPSKAIKARVASSRSLMCSQLVDRIYLDAGVHLFDDGRQPGDVTPGDLARYITDHGWTANGPKVVT